jgi:acyl dehydratase
VNSPQKDVVSQGIQALHAGRDLGPSDWVHVTQDMINLFGAATLDLDPMHVDPLWAREQSPYGDTIAFGFLTMSLLTHLVQSVLQTQSVDTSLRAGYFLNYGFDRVRLVSPVKANQRIRGHFRVLKVRRNDDDRPVLTFGCEVEVEGGSRPALVAEWLAIWIARPLSSSSTPREPSA